MNAIRFFVLFFACVYLQTTSTTYAGNESFLDYSAISYFQGEDSKMMMDNILTALDHYPDGKKAPWKNSNTGNFGYALPSNTTKINGQLCRNVLIFNDARGVTSEAKYKLCKFGNSWKFVENND